MIYDISQPLFDCAVYPGDPVPEKKPVMRISDGAVCNLTAFSMCAHNGTHVDAPYHFFDNGRTIDEIPLDKFIGPCYVAVTEGDINEDEAKCILEKAKRFACGCEKKILIKGKITVTEQAAAIFAGAGIDLIGNESPTVGPFDAPMKVHLILLRAGIVLLEGIRLDAVREGVYILNCAPLNLAGTDGAPCRAVLTDI